MNAANSKLSATQGTSLAAVLGTIPKSLEKNKQWQRELLMERIRSHSSQLRSFADLSKAMRLSFLDKRYPLDAVEKLNLQKCLDSIQYCIKVTSRQGLVERLESLSRQLGLKFMEDKTGLFISTDMFYLEIVLDSNGTLSDVKVHHECKIEQQSCSELVNCLNRGDFADFTVQLEGLSSIYQLNAEPKIKTKAFVALQAMETDLYNLYQMQDFSKNPEEILNSSSVGIVLKRRGGHPMKLIYFVSPYDLIVLDDNAMQSFTLELLTTNSVGLSATVVLEASSANRLQIAPTVTISKNHQLEDKLEPTYAPLISLNSMLLPATFVLRLNKPLPVCPTSLRAFGVSVGVTDPGSSSSCLDSQIHKSSAKSYSNLMNLIVQTASEEIIKNPHKGLFVYLPDQTHCYFFTENRQLKASLISSVPFTEPSQVTKILDLLKKHALFYNLLSSCVRPQPKVGSDMDSTTILEINVTSFEQIAVSLQHPYEESMTTVEFELSNGNVKCKIFSVGQNYDILSLKLTNVVQKTLSIPVTIRTLLKFWDQERIKIFRRNNKNGGDAASQSHNNSNSFANFSLVLVPNDSGGRVNNNGTVLAPSAVGNVLKVETNQLNTVSATTGSYMQCKNENSSQEDFHESPKSQEIHVLAETCSLGQSNKTQKQHMPNAEQEIITTKASDIEIADKYKNIWKDKTYNLKNCINVVSSIVNATENNAGQNQQLSVKRTGGIEIIPLTSQTVTSTVIGMNNTSISTSPQQSSSITITPINTISGNSGGFNLKDKKSSSISCSTTSAGNTISVASSSNSSKRSMENALILSPSDTQKEKKRKKKRDDSPMGPPEKVFSSRQNSPAATADGGPNTSARKFSSPSSSPKGCSGINNSGVAILTSSGNYSLNTRPSPKHSPAYSSPKHNTSSNSPKSPFGTHSPKHSSSGKPSMSTLKSAAATSLSPKSEKAIGYCSSLSSLIGATAATFVRSISDSGSGRISPTSSSCTATNIKLREKERDRTNSTISTSALTSTVGTLDNILQATTANQFQQPIVANNITSSSGLNDFTGGETISVDPSIRKTGNSAVSLMTSKATTLSNSPVTLHNQQQQKHHGSDSQDYLEKKQTSPSEYMVKTSQEGLKLTINKTNTKSFTGNQKERLKIITSNNNTSTTSVKKVHTGLKPGVNSGPASKKPPTISNKKCVINELKTVDTSQSSKRLQRYTKHLFQKSNSSDNIVTKVSATNTDGTGIIKVMNKSKSAHSFADIVSLQCKTYKSEFSNKKLNIGGTNLPDTAINQKVDMIKILQYASPAVAASMEGFIKNFGSKFQIPKISQRTAAAPSSSAISLASTSTIGSISTSPLAVLKSTSESTKSTDDFPSNIFNKKKYLEEEAPGKETPITHIIAKSQYSASEILEKNIAESLPISDGIDQQPASPSNLLESPGATSVACLQQT